jgi:SAM-dependent methyltransferase
MKDEKLWEFYQTDSNHKNKHFTAGYKRNKMLFHKIRKNIKYGRVLEVGIGDGYLLSLLKSQNKVYGVDLSQSAVDQISQKLGADVEIKQGDITRLDYDDSFFDCVVASEVIEHLTDEQLNDGLSEVYRVLRDGGCFVISVPDREDLKDNEVICPHCLEKFHKVGHKQSFSESRLSEIFTNKGYQSITFSRYYDLFNQFPFPIDKLAKVIKRMFANKADSLIAVVKK